MQSQFDIFSSSYGIVRLSFLVSLACTHSLPSTPAKQTGRSRERKESSSHRTYEEERKENSFSLSRTESNKSPCHSGRKTAQTPLFHTTFSLGTISNGYVQQGHDYTALHRRRRNPTAHFFRNEKESSIFMAAPLLFLSRKGGSGNTYS